MKNTLSVLILQGFFLGAYAQQDMMVSKYMFNGLFLNPAYGGTHPYFTTSLLYRTQWTGLSGAPKTQLFELDGPIAKEKMGVGCIISHDKIGVTEQTDFFATYSYKIQLGKDKLSFGLRAGVSDCRAHLASLTYWDANDVVFRNDIKSALVPKFGFGIYYYSEKYYTGLSIPTLIAYDKDYRFSIDLEKSSYLRRHYYFNGGYIFTLNELLKLKPSILIKYSPTVPLQADINVSILYKERIWFGTSFRTGDAVVFLVEYQTSNRIRIGYAFDYTISNLQKYSNGSHEIMVAYDLGKEKIKIATPRFF
ncbi:MAG: type IX secretion system membrane protein PorP/SprF [Bacteroidetes bacterium]|nr:type IX secretion system membrane protein PorP/SprF [Bacteroidota bacterium]